MLAFATRRIRFRLLEERILRSVSYYSMTATTRDIRCAMRVLAHQFTLRFGTRRLHALPVTLRLCTNGLTFRFRSFAFGKALWLVAYNRALRTSFVPTS